MGHRLSKETNAKKESECNREIFGTAEPNNCIITNKLVEQPTQVTFKIILTKMEKPDYMNDASAVDNEPTSLSISTENNLISNDAPNQITISDNEQLINNLELNNLNISVTNHTNLISSDTENNINIPFIECETNSEIPSVIDNEVSNQENGNLSELPAVADGLERKIFKFGTLLNINENSTANCDNNNAEQYSSNEIMRRYTEKYPMNESLRHNSQQSLPDNLRLTAAGSNLNNLASNSSTLNSPAMAPAHCIACSNPFDPIRPLSFCVNRATASTSASQGITIGCGSVQQQTIPVPDTQQQPNKMKRNTWGLNCVRNRGNNNNRSTEPLSQNDGNGVSSRQVSNQNTTPRINSELVNCSGTDQQSLNRLNTTIAPIQRSSNVMNSIISSEILSLERLMATRLGTATGHLLHPIQATTRASIQFLLMADVDLDEQARIRRAQEIEEGVDPPPNLIPDASGELNRRQLEQRNQSVPTKIHSQVDYIHCLVPDLHKLISCGFYWGKIDRYEAERLLDGKPEGTFLLRDSAQEEFLFSVSFRKYNKSLHARIEHHNHKFSFDCHDPGVFSSPTVTDLLRHYTDPACVMFFEPYLSIPLNRNFTFSLQSLCRASIASRVTYDSISNLNLPPSMKSYLREYHYKQKVRVKRLDQSEYYNTS